MWNVGFTKSSFVAGEQPNVEEEQKTEGNSKHGRHQCQKQDMQFNTTIEQFALRERERERGKKFIVCLQQIN